MEIVAFLLVLPFVLWGGCHIAESLKDHRMHEEYHWARHQSVHQCEGPGVCDFVCMHNRRRATCSKCKEMQVYATPSKERINQYRQQQQNNTVVINGLLYVERVVDGEVMYVRAKEPIVRRNINSNVVNGAAVQVMQHSMLNPASPMSPIAVK